MNKKKFNQLDKRNSKADILHRMIRLDGIDFATGVPCGVLRHIIDNLLNDPDILHMIANRESEAIGLAAGAYFAGKKPVIYMQNSGLFDASNDIASLLIPYRIPILLIVSYRGCEGEDAIQHLTTGKATQPLIESFGLHYAVYDGEDISAFMEGMFAEMEATGLPAVLLLKRGWHL